MQVNFDTFHKNWEYPTYPCQSGAWPHFVFNFLVSVLASLAYIKWQVYQLSRKTPATPDGQSLFIQQFFWSFLKLW